jgi:hypothetical protein
VRLWLNLKDCWASSTNRDPQVVMKVLLFLSKLIRKLFKKRFIRERSRVAIKPSFHAQSMISSLLVIVFIFGSILILLLFSGLFQHL